MAEKTIMLACAAGMSTSLLVNKMQKAADEKGLDFEIFAASVSEAKDKVEEKAVDVILLGPQVRYMQQEFEDKFGSQGIPIAVIPMTDYGMMNGEKIIALAEETMNEVI